MAETHEDLLYQAVGKFGVYTTGSHITLDSTNYTLTPEFTAYLSQFVSGCQDRDPTSINYFKPPASQNVHELTNAQLFGLEKNVSERFILASNVFKLAKDAILNDTLTEFTDQDDFWASHMGSDSVQGDESETNWQLTQDIAGKAEASAVGALVASALGTMDTDDLTEGATNKYFTDARSRAAFTSYVDHTAKSGSFPVFKEVTVASNQVQFHLTDDGTSTGAALFPNGPDLKSLQLTGDDTTGDSPMAFGAAVLSNSNKTVTLPVTKAANVLGVLTISQSANGDKVRASIWGN